MASGFFCIDKSSGYTSHDVVARIRKIIGMKKVGHSGTLDPMATGVMIIGFGTCTRLLDYVQSGEKTYEATIKFGEKTTTADFESEVIETKDMSSLTRSELEDCLAHFIGIIEQTPPMVSAIKVDGKKLYEYQREGIEIKRKKRKVEIKEINLIDFLNDTSQTPTAKISVTCSSGTYIRTLAEDIASQLGGYAHLTALRRTKNGMVDVEKCITINELGNIDQPISNSVKPRDILNHLTQIDLDADQAKDLSHGKRIQLNKKQLKAISETGKTTIAAFAAKPFELCAIFKIDSMENFSDQDYLKSSCIVFLED